MKIKFILIFLSIAALVFGCAKPPEELMQSAREAVFRAENDADAVQFAGSLLSRAQSALRRMQEEADAKNYEAAAVLAEEAIMAAQRAVTDGRVNAARAREEAALLLAGLPSEIDETNRNLSAARYSDMALDYDALDRGIRDAYSGADRAQDALNRGGIQDALDGARQVRSDLSSINQTITGAVTRSK